MSEFGDGWEGVALVIEGFTRGDGWVTRLGDTKGERIAKGADMVVTGACGPLKEGGDKVGVAEEGWFGLLERALVGKVGLVGNTGVGFLAMKEWVGRWWKMAKIRPIAGRDFLFVFPSQREAENVLR